MATRSPACHWLVLSAMLGCGSSGGGAPDVDAEAAAPGPDCAALIEAARRAERCDPVLPQLASTLEAEPDEARCRVEVRRILGPDRPVEVASLYAPPWPDGRTPLDEEERARLADLAQPASVRIEPDLAPSPGRPLTAARLGQRALSRAEEDGTLTAYRPPGAYTLTLQHADEMRSHCLRLEPCAAVSLTAHGAQLASHPAVSAGPCPGDEVDPDAVRLTTAADPERP